MLKSEREYKSFNVEPQEFVKQLFAPVNNTKRV